MIRRSYSPINSIVFISHSLESKSPEHRYGELVSHNEYTVSVGCYPEIDGETELCLGMANEVVDGQLLVFDGVLKTPNRKLMISTVLGEVLLEQDVRDIRTRTRVWVDHLRWPKTVTVGWGE